MTSTEVQQFRVLATAGNQPDQVQHGVVLVALGQKLLGDEPVCGCSSSSAWEGGLL
jgi:hypothetical protein